MLDDVVKAVQTNAQPSEDEETIIILSPISREEMVAVRSLVAKYEGKKKIILVNSHLEPIPRELRQAETVYSVLPLVANIRKSGVNIFASQNAEEEALPPKVVVMRRYPRDWEVYVDIGHGFELAGSAPAGSVDKKGPSIEWIAGSVKRFLQSK